MTTKLYHKIFIGGLLVLLPILALYYLTLGSIDISFSEIWSSVFHYDETNLKQLIVHEYRLPRMFMAFLAGASLSVAGLLMQTLFNNPLAGPYVLGINSGASLFVGLSTLSGIYFFSEELGVVLSSFLGAFIFGLIVLVVAKWVKSAVSLLLVGLMIGSFSGALVSLFQSSAELQSLKAFTMWSLGSLQNVETGSLPLIITIFFVGCIGTFLLIKPLNQLVLGEGRAESLGVRIKQVRIYVIIVTALLTGLITAFCGPIGFVGLAVPNLLRIGLRTRNHAVLIPASILFGGVFLMLCDIFILHLEELIHIPINVLTILIGSPIVVMVILKKLG